MRRLLCIPIIVATVLLVGAGVAPGVDGDSPIVPANRPTPLIGAVNGEVSRSRLINVAPNCMAAREAASSLARLFAMARQRRIGLGADECYRLLSEEIQFAHQAAQPGNNPACVASLGRSSTGQVVGQSYHGWGKAADLTDAGQSLTFASPGYAFMKQVAGSLGWNHPAFAEPGGSSCPEPWHWEWVGDGGSLHRRSISGDVVALLPSADDQGYATVTGLGALGRHGDFPDRGNAASLPLQWVIVAAHNTPGRGGYWMVGADGGVFSFGDARFFGSTASFRLAQPVNGIAPSPTGHGYWLLAWDGGVFSFGDARFHGSTGGMRLNAPVDGIAPTPTGNGYWLVASDGGVFAFGDAHFYGSMGGLHLNAPIVGIEPTPSGKGYFLVASDGGVFAFGDAKFVFSLAGTGAPSPIVAIVPTKTNQGYWVTLADGEVIGIGHDAHTYP